MREIVVATRNRGKIKELQALLAGAVDTIHCAADIPGFPETVEDGTTFQENALKKAREAMAFSGLPALADDSGLEVAALGGRPGVFSARYAGEGCGDAANNHKLLSELADISEEFRQAAFVCAVAFVDIDGSEQLFSGRVTGRILHHQRGQGGFGYDPLFLVDGFAETMAELSLEVKNSISHRGQALQQFSQFLSAGRQ